MTKLKPKNILIAALLALGVFFFTRPVIVSALPGLAQNNSNLIYETEVKISSEGFSQIVIKDQSGKITFITDENLTHASPVIDNDLVAWTAQTDTGWQIFYHNISTKKTVQLTNSGNNVNPQISGNHVAWEGVKGGTWQIFLFDGMKITQITESGGPKQDIDLKDGLLTYSAKESSGWQIYLHNIGSKSTEKISQRGSNRNPTIENSTVIWESGADSGLTMFEYNMTNKSIRKLAKNAGGDAEGAVASDFDTNVTTEYSSEIAEGGIAAEGTHDTVKNITIEDIKEELKITEEETPESTESENEPLQELVQTEEIKESTSSEN